MNKSFLVFLFFLLIGQAHLSAQQLPSFNQYYFTPLVYNPSYVGFDEGVQVGLIRNQKWWNYGEGFNANQLTVSSRLKERHGLGINLYSDYVGITSKLKAHLLYSYAIKLGDKMFLRAGVAAGVIDNRIDFSNAIVSNVNDPVLVNVSNDRKTFFDMNVGINFNYDQFRIGFSVPQVLGSSLQYGEDATSFYTVERQFLATTGYTWRFNETLGMSVSPEAMVMYTSGAPFNYNAGFIFEMDRYFWLGAMYKSDYAIGLNLGVNAVKNLKIGFAYDIQVHEVAALSSMPNMEIMLRYTIPQLSKEPDYSEYDKMLADKQRELDSLTAVKEQNERDAENRINNLEETNQILEDSLAKWPKNNGQSNVRTDDPNGSPATSNSLDHFTELSGNDSPTGYYVIGGAFADKSNADALIRKIKSMFPNARIIFNDRNQLYYVSLYYSKEKGEGLAYASYKASQLPDEETWVLCYKCGQ